MPSKPSHLKCPVVFSILAFSIVLKSRLTAKLLLDSLGDQTIGKGKGQLFFKTGTFMRSSLLYVEERGEHLLCFLWYQNMYFFGGGGEFKLTL